MVYSEWKPLIHVAENNNINPDTGVIAHVALDGADYESLLSNLKKQHYYYNEKHVPLSGERQVFIAGPDGLIVEMLFQLRDSDNKPHSYLEKPY